MRFPEERVRAAILHPDPEIRMSAVEYYTYSYSTDPAIMPLVIAAVEKYGDEEGSQPLIWADRLVQTAATIDWAVRTLTRSATGDLPRRLERLLLAVDPRLVLAHRDNLAGMRAELLGDLDRRLALLERGSQDLWSELTCICEQGFEEGEEEFDASRAGNVADVLAGRPESASFALAALARPLMEEQDSADWWLMPYAARLAGELRLEAALPDLIAKLHLDSDYLDEECETALVRIGTPQVVEAVAAAWPTGTETFQHYSSFVLGNIHTDRAVQALGEIFATKASPKLRSAVAEAFLNQFATEGIDAALQALADGTRDFLHSMLRQATVDAAEFMRFSSPAIEALKREIARETEADEARRDELGEDLMGQLLFAVERLSGQRAPLPGPHYDPSDLFVDDSLAEPGEPIVHSGPRVGRNEPCPCGSGRKFKQCCLRKQQTRA